MKTAFSLSSLAVCIAYMHTCWRHLQYATVHVWHRKCICMSKWITSWSQPYRYQIVPSDKKCRSWSGLETPAHPNARTLFDIALDSHIGNGNNTLFWTDKWLFGCSIADLAPNVIIAVPRKFWKRSVAEVFQDQ
jgi:hypothetical protein